MRMLVLLIPALAVAAPIFEQVAGDYRVEVSRRPSGWFDPLFDVVFDGPSGAFQYIIRSEVISQVILGSRGVLALAGEDTSNEWVTLITYGEAPRPPWQPLGRLPVDVCFDHFMQLRGCVLRDHNWMPAIYIQNERLYAEMKAHFKVQLPGFPPTYSFPAYQYTYDYGVEMGAAAIPEPATLGLLSLGLALCLLSRARNRCVLLAWTSSADSGTCNAGKRGPKRSR